MISVSGVFRLLPALAWLSPVAPTRYPLADRQKAQLFQLIEALETAGVLQAGETSREEIIDCAETIDEFTSLDIVDVANILDALQSQRRRPFAHLSFFADQVEVSEADVLVMVQEFARLSGQAGHLGATRLKGVGGDKIVPARRGEFPPNNAVVEFDLGTRRYTVPFVMYSKNIPGGLLERLAKAFAQTEDVRRLFVANFDSFVSLTYLLPEKAVVLNSALSGEPTWFPLLGSS